MKVFLDANVLVSVLNKEYPLYNWSSRVLSLHGNWEVQLYTSPLCLAIAFYFAGKKSGDKVANHKLRMLCDHISITSLNGSVVSQVLRDHRITDFEDGLEYYSALQSGCDYIVTEDGGDFWFSSVQVMDCRGFLQYLQQK
jgi:predicted nucleic acid-binding protein